MSCTKRQANDIVLEPAYKSKLQIDFNNEYFRQTPGTHIIECPLQLVYTASKAQLRAKTKGQEQ